MSNEVQLFYNELQADQSQLQQSASTLVNNNAMLNSADSGVGAPAGRQELENLLRDRIDTLHNVVLSRAGSASSLSVLLGQIVSHYTDLDKELLGKDDPTWP